jgi:hypothetical protein
MALRDAVSPFLFSLFPLSGFMAEKRPSLLLGQFSATDCYLFEMTNNHNLKMRPQASLEKDQLGVWSKCTFAW